VRPWGALQWAAGSSRAEGCSHGARTPAPTPTHLEAGKPMDMTVATSRSAGLSTTPSDTTLRAHAVRAQGVGGWVGRVHGRGGGMGAWVHGCMGVVGAGAHCRSTIGSLVSIHEGGRAEGTCPGGKQELQPLPAAYSPGAPPPSH